MKLNLYHTNDNPNTVNKKLDLVRSVDITLREAINEKAPQLVLHNSNLDGVNYLELPAFKRFYFIDHINSYNNQISTVACSTDLLMTYKELILNSQVQITATEKPSYVSSSLPTLSKTSKRIEKSTVTLPTVNSIVLTTVGGISKEK